MPIRSVGNLEVIESGVVLIAPSNPPVILVVSDLEFILEFAPPKAAEKPLIVPEKTGDRTMTLRFRGWDSEAGVSAQLKIGTLEDRDLYLSIYSQVIGTEKRYSRHLAYTLDRGPQR
jgi:hypothetical protein